MPDDSRYWRDKDRYLLVHLQDRRVIPEIHYAIVENYSYHCGVVIEDDAQFAEITRRMLAAGVRIVTHKEAERLRTTPLWSESDPQKLYLSPTADARHVRLRDGRFQRVFAGPDRALFIGHEHILAERALAEVIANHAGANAGLTPAIVYDPQTGRELDSFCELRPLHELSPRALRTNCYEASAGVWHFKHEHLFVSPALREEIERLGLPGLSFSPGYELNRGMIQGHW